jgi:hypothetical protein
MAINFPSSPTEGQAYSGYRYLNGAWQKSPTGMALEKNYIVNPAMQISQENGTNYITANALYPVDQFQFQTTIATTGAAKIVNAASAPMPYCFSTNIVTPKPSLVAGDLWQIVQFIEGVNIVDFRFGAPQAQPLVARFKASCTQAGTYTFVFKNGANDQVFMAPFTIPGAGWYEFVISIPARTVGTWPIDTTRGAAVAWGLAAGPTLNTGVAGWQTTSLVQIAGNTNLAAAVNSFNLADVGLYLDPYATGIAPPFEMPNYTAELRACQRYWYRAFGLRGGAASATQAARIGAPHPVQMRIVPTVATVGLPKVYDGLATPTLPAATLSTFNTVNTLELNYTVAGLTAGRPALQYWENEGYYIAVSARM